MNVFKRLCLRSLALIGLAAWVFQLAAAEPRKQTEMVRMRDGVRLATDIYLPEGTGAWPVILIRSPYNKAPMAGICADGIRRGYAMVVQDCRGRFASEGENLPFHLDHLDGPDTMKWLVAQSWCSGKVGTWGGSAVGITQLMMAGRNGPQPTCQHITVGAPNLYEGMFPGGVFKKAMLEDWIRVSQFSSNALPAWVAHPGFDAYWKERDTTPVYPKVASPAVHLGGWYDIFAQGTIDSFVGYQEKGGPKAKGKQKLVMGPWTHGVLQSKAGELQFPDNAKKPPGNVQDPWLWYDYWLKGVENGAATLPAVTYYVMGDVTDPQAPGNEWRVADRWPPAPATPTSWYLNQDRTLTLTKPATAAPLVYDYDPSNPVPSMGGLQLTIPAGGMDQRKIEERPDMLVFTSAPLEKPMEVTGRVRVRLWVRSDAPDTDFVARLCDVYPDGRSFNVCEGQRRARFRNSFAKEEMMKPGRVYPLEVDLWSTSILFNRGHRLRVHVSSSSAPGYDPNPNTGEAFRHGNSRRIARNEIFVDRKHPSQIVLPVMQDRR
jgi:predicted acyl esterase